MLAVFPSAAEQQLSASRHEQLRELIRHDCGACHGMTLNGGLGPPLTVDTLAGRPEADLVSIILNGKAQTAMPPWKGLLTTGEATWIVRQLKSGETGNK